MPGRRTSPSREVRIKVANPSDEETTLVLEPWGETFTMPPGAAIEVVGRGPDTDTVEISFQDEVISVWGWAGSVLSLFHGESELGDAKSRPPSLLATLQPPLRLHPVT